MSLSTPKFLNPHSAAISAEPSSRSKIFGDNESDHLSGLEVLNKNLEEELRWLEEHLRSSLVPLVDNGAESRPSKRRRVSKKDDVEAILFEFRLLQGDSPRKISVLPKPPKVIKFVEPEYEDSAEGAELRARQAKNVAVDFAWVIAQSKPSYPCSTDGKQKPSKLFTSSGPPSVVPSSILVAECLKTMAPFRPYLRPTDAKPSPHELKGGLCCPLLSISPYGTAERKKRRMRSAPKRRPALT